MSPLVFLLLISYFFCKCFSYEQTWASLDTRPIPTWYDDEKYGIFMHWGLFSVPGLHDAWFWYAWKVQKDPSLIEFMEQNYKPNFGYADFGPDFTSELFSPTEFARILKSSGANIPYCTSRYTPDWSSLDTRPLPGWYEDAKFGLFMHWGLYSVPSVSSEWFWWTWQGDKSPALKYFMQKNYKPGFTYQDFASLFTTEFFDAKVFANIIAKSGAQYFVLTSKHHEGFTMWPSNYSWNWDAKNVGPHRDLVGELATAVRQAGIRFGLYYSLFAWFHPLYLKDKLNLFSTKEYVQSIVMPQLKEIVTQYKPEVIWSDGDWEASWQYWNSTDFIAWLYNDSPVKDTIVTNDRWGIGTLCEHGDFFTCQDKYNPGHLLPHKWENCMTIDRNSWGFRRDARYEDFLSVQEIIATLASTISCGGNLLLNVGPTHDGRITPIFEERLTQMGQYVKVNSEAIFKSKPWIYQNDTVTPNIWYTSKLSDQRRQNPRRVYNPQVAGNTVVYAFMLRWPSDNLLNLGAPKGTAYTKVTMLGYSGNIIFKVRQTGGISVDLSKVMWNELPNTWSWVLKIENLASEYREPNLFEAKQFVTDPKRREQIFGY